MRLSRDIGGRCVRHRCLGVSFARMTVFVLVATLLGACGSSGGAAAPATVAAPAPSPTVGTDINLLFMGNSHTSVNNLTGMVTAMMRAGFPSKSVAAVEAPGWMFLEERPADTASLNLLRSRQWSFVILQAQKYSSSGRFSYSTAEAEELIRLSRIQSALPVLFPEWSRKGIAETQRMIDLHTSIARKQPACIAPIPQAFDLAQSRHPQLVLHDRDGNHSAPAGAFLAALILYATMSNLSPLTLPTLPQFGVGDDTQSMLRAIAAETVQANSPRLWCPRDECRETGKPEAWYGISAADDCGKTLARQTIRQPDGQRVLN